MSNFTNVLKNGYKNLEAELEAGLIDNPEADNETIEEDNTSNIQADVKLSEVNENDLFDMEEDTSIPDDTNETETDISQEAAVDIDEIEDIDNTDEDSDKEIEDTYDNEPSTDIEKVIIDSYNEVWDFFKEWSSLTKEDKKDITKGKDIFSFTPIEAFSLLEDWKESKRIHIGDVITNNGITGICVEISIKDKNGNDCYLVSTGDEKLSYFDKETTVKTEKHIDIKKLL